MLGATGTVEAALRRAAVRATRAPSVHNTQPWRFVLGRDELEIHADHSRRLTVVDPFGRQLVLSCGCALFNARVTLAASGVTTSVQRFPDRLRPNLLARIAFDASAEPEARDLVVLDHAIDVRRTNRRQFAAEPVPHSTVTALVEAARREGADAYPVVSTEARRVVAQLSQQADRFENADPAYRAELRAWTRRDPAREDGVPASAVPHVDGKAREDLPIRDFDTHGLGWLPAGTGSNADQCLLLIGTAGDDPAAWLRAGEALERVLLELTGRGFVASPFTQLIEVAHTNAELRRELELTMHPHILLRVGRAPQTPATRRRFLVDVLTEAE